METDRFVELSHPISDGLETYPGLPAPHVENHLPRDQAHLHYAAGTSFAISAITMVGNTGTYLDAPFHRFEDGKDLAELPLSSLADLPGLCVRIGTAPIDEGVFEGLDLFGKAVLVLTGWSQHWGKERYMDGYPFLTLGAAERLVEGGARLVGIDSPNIDDNTDGRRPVHTELLAAEVPIVEHMTGLEALPEDGFRFFAVPPMLRKFTSFPVRAFALIASFP